MIELIITLIIILISIIAYLRGSSYSGGAEDEYSTLKKEIESQRNLLPVITLDDIKHSLSYQPGFKIDRIPLHHGQRKLFLGELKFIVEHVPLKEQSSSGKDTLSEKQFIVYAGAAPGVPTGFLADLVGDNIVFLLVDPTPFEIADKKPIYLKGSPEEMIRQVKEGRGIYIINDLFTIPLAEEIGRTLPEAFFISDIRTNVYEGKDFPDSLDILWNLAQQYNWIKAMGSPGRFRPDMLKFRHPFYEEDPKIFQEKCRESPYKEDFARAKENGIDFIKNFQSRKLVYLDGVVDLQAFAGPTSTETRLITTGGIKNWGTPATYEDHFFYHNKIARPYGHYFNDNASPELGFDHCADCALENYIWKAYIKKYSRSESVPELVARLSQITGHSLIRGYHPFQP